MSLWRQITRGLRALLNRRAADQNIANEVESYFDQAAAESLARGISPKEARRAARLEFGAAIAAHEQVRGSGWENAIAGPLADVGYAARRLRANPGFTAVSLLTLALGIGASTAIFSVIEGVLLKPLPYPHSEQIVALRHTAPGVHIPNLGLAVSLYFTYSEENRVFQDVGMWQTGAGTVTGLGEPEEVRGISVTHRFLPVLGIQPALGRPFAASDEDPQGNRTVMLSDGYWKAHFGGDRTVLGRRIVLDGEAYEIVGVLPPRFEFMDRPVSLVMPLRSRRADTRLISFCCQGIARLKTGVTLAQVNADVARMLQIAPAKFPMGAGFSADAFTAARIAPNVMWLKNDLVGDVSDTLWVLMGTVGIVLLIACANVANLLLVRADGRRQELAVRAALGAGWGRIARELLIESMLLGIAGGALGLTLAYGALRALTASDRVQLPRLHEISIDPQVLAYALGVSLAAGLLFGLIPVFKYARPQLSGGLRSAGRSVSSSRERQHARSLLVVIQVALALVLLVGSGLMIRTFQALHHVDPGFSGAAELETMQTAIPSTQVKEPERVMRMEEAILRNLEALPRVSAVAITTGVPLESCCLNNPVYAEDQSPRAGTIPPVRRFKFISPGYFSAIGSRLIAGRELTWEDLYGPRPVAIVSESLARELWHEPRAAIGKRVRSLINDDWREVVGVAADLRDDGIDQKAPAILYLPLLTKNFGSGGPVARGVVYIIRTPRAGSAPFRQELQRAVAKANPLLPVWNVKTLQSVYDQSLARASLSLLLLAIAGGMALLLGIVGLYGVISYSVSQRTREIGIRLALGAPLSDVTRLFVRHGLAMSAIGAACGLAAALALTRLMKSLLFEVSPADPLTYAAATAGLIAAAVLASYLPARRATRVDPVEALRAE